MMFTVFDIVVFTIIAVSTVMGLYKGLLGIAINLLGFIASIVAAIFLFPYVKLGLTGHIENSLLLSILSAIIAYIGSLFVLTFITSRISSLLKVISGGFFDRALGSLVGFVRGVLISTVIFTLIVIFLSGAYLKAQNADEVISNIDSEKYPVWLTNSKTSDYLEKSLNKLISFLPEDSLKSIELPSTNTEKDQDIIDMINSEKEQDSGSSVSIDEILENDTQELIDDNDSNDF